MSTEGPSVAGIRAFRSGDERDAQGAHTVCLSQSRSFQKAQSTIGSGMKGSLCSSGPGTFSLSLAPFPSSLWCPLFLSFILSFILSIIFLFFFFVWFWAFVLFDVCQYWWFMGILKLKGRYTSLTIYLSSTPLSPSASVSLSLSAIISLQSFLLCFFLSLTSAHILPLSQSGSLCLPPSSVSCPHFLFSAENLLVKLSWWHEQDRASQGVYSANTISNNNTGSKLHCISVNRWTGNKFGTIWVG